MARNRQTINVEEVKDWANQQFESTESVDRAWRQGVMTMLENILLSTGNYKGFRYLALDEVPAGRMPGIRRELRTTAPVPFNTEEVDHFCNTDNTRVRYF